MLLTNAPRPKNAVKAHLSTFGISEEHFNDITTSGDAAQNSMLSGDVGTKVFHLGPKRDVSFFNDIPPDRKLTNKINVVEFLQLRVLFVRDYLMIVLKHQKIIKI